MKILSFVRSNLFRIFSIIFVGGFLLGGLNTHFSDKHDYCAMTYMFEYPQFVQVSLAENKIYPQYGLYAYSEGRLTERARKMWFEGVPVLFLPGNSGSHMQARALASVALRKAMSKQYDFHFDFFTISYNEELSGLYGGVLQRQTQFAAACVSKILSLYKSNMYTKTVPTSVILIGHSMGGLIAKRLLAFPATLNSSNIAITLAAPVKAPVVNFDIAMNDYYLHMKYEWINYLNKDPEIKRRKVLISFGGGARDVLVQSPLTSSKDSHISALTTAVPGVWVSPDHVAIVWCKQLVMVINRYLFSIVDTRTLQVDGNQTALLSKAEYYFQANRSMVLNPNITRANASMVADAFWYEDNRRMYQVTRPDNDRMMYLMIRLVSFPQHRFAAVEAINIEDKDWIFGCSAKYTLQYHRYCKQATSLTELSRWTGSTADFGRRKIATIDLHKLIDSNPEWTHVIVKISPSTKPISFNVDINDYASRRINVALPNDFSLGKSTIIQETETDAIYYELVLEGFNVIHQAYLLYVEPSEQCKTNNYKYHASAELHMPWAKNHEYTHYFTHLKKSPMKLRLTKSNPNITFDLEPMEYAKVTLLLDPKCTFTISISNSWYHRLAQFTRNYCPVLAPYIAGIVMLAAKSNIQKVLETGTCLSIHSALASEPVKPYYALVFARLATLVLVSTPVLANLLKNVAWQDLEMMHFVKSVLVLPSYMIALGILNIGAAAIIGAMVFSSQIAHRLLFRLVWRGGAGLAENVASGLRKVPMVVSAGLVCAVPLACGAAALAAGAAFYAFMLSKMYEEYLEDYVYKLMAKVASKICRMFKRNENRNMDASNQEASAVRENEDSSTADVAIVKKKCKEPNDVIEEVDEKLNSLNFHMMLFFMWLVVTLVNAPVLLSWARDFKYNMALSPDTSYHTGLVMSICSTCVWQLEGPRKNLRYYEAVSALLFTMAIFILALGPLSMTIVNYGVTFMFAVITMQQVCDVEERKVKVENKQDNIEENEEDNEESKLESDTGKESDSAENETDSNKNVNEEPKSAEASANETGESSDHCDVCNESRIYNAFKTIRDKFSFNQDEEPVGN